VDPRGHSAAGRFRLTDKSCDGIRNRTRDLPVCIIMPQLITLPRVIKIILPTTFIEIRPEFPEMKHADTHDLTIMRQL
jgi:hypothetical protein